MPDLKLNIFRTSWVVFGAVGLLLAGASGAVFAQTSGGAGAERIGSDFDFAMGDFARDRAIVEYGTLKLQPDGKVDAQVWTCSARDPIPAMADTGRLSPTIEPAERSVQTDKGHKVLSNPRAFAGNARAVGGNWWEAGGGVCLRLEQQPVVFLKRIPLAKQERWGALYWNADDRNACQSARPAAKLGTFSMAESSTKAVLSERVFDRSNPDIKVKYQRFDGAISRLNGWDNKCPLSDWEKTELNFTNGTFEAAGKDVWRAITMEHQPKGQPDMAVFSYIALPSEMTPAGRVVLMDVGHDFNRNGRIDDDWGHIYAGFPIVNRDGDLGGMLMVDMSPVGIREIPYHGGCMMPGGSQYTNTLGLILYVSKELGPNLSR